MSQLEGFTVLGKEHLVSCDNASNNDTMINEIKVQGILRSQHGNNTIPVMYHHWI